METNEMEMPTLCDCGVWFDLHDGYSNYYGTRTICENCARQNKEREEKESEIKENESLIEDYQCEISSLKENINEIKEDLKKMPEYL